LMEAPGPAVAEAAWRQTLRSHPQLWRLLFDGDGEAVRKARARHPALERMFAALGPPPQHLWGEATPAFEVPEVLPFDDSASLSADQLGTFAEAGLVIIPGAVPAHLVGGALRRINSAIGSGKLVGDAGSALGLAPEVGSAPEIMDLFYASPVVTYAQRLIGRGRVEPVRKSQVALRFPSASASAPPTPAGSAWHIDGFGKGQHSPFALLCGVCLSETPGPMCGNLAVYPGQHVRLQQAILEAVTSGSAAAFSLSSEEHSDGDAAGGSKAHAKPDLGQPRQLCLHPGDVVLVHQKIPHMGMPNASPHVRYMVYFRLRHIDHNALKEGWLRDVMLPFEGCRRT